MPIVGVAVPIPEPWATQLRDYRHSIGDAQAETTPTHITLVPPTEVEELSEVKAVLDEASARVDGFEVHLRGTGTFRPTSPVVFVSVAQGIAQCERLAEAVRQGPLETDLKFPYHPHVTVAQHVPEAALDRAFDELADFDCQFDVDHFHLYVHDDRSGWRPLRTYPLGHEPQPQPGDR